MSMIGTWMATGMTVAGLFTEPAPPVQDPPVMSTAPSPVVHTISYLAYHPDLRYQLDGQAALDDGKFSKALWLFEKSAAYGDKGSQAMIAEMHWEGLGTPRNRAMAYAWMDLASSRGSRKLTLLREHYWLQLTEAERAEALRLGPHVYTAFGDAQTMVRMQEKLRSFERHRRWSRAMSAGVTAHYLLTPGGGRIKVDSIGGRGDPHWDPERYLEWRDAHFENPGGARVEVGELVSNPDAGSARAGEQ